MAREVKQEDNNKGPSTLTLTLSGIISIAGLIAGGITTYNAIQNDIATLKRGEVYQERVNEQTREDLKSIQSDLKEVRTEQREAMKEFGGKVDGLIETWYRRRK